MGCQNTHRLWDTLYDGRTDWRTSEHCFSGGLSSSLRRAWSIPDPGNFQPLNHEKESIYFYWELILNRFRFQHFWGSTPPYFVPFFIQHALSRSPTTLSPLSESPDSPEVKRGNGWMRRRLSCTTESLKTVPPRLREWPPEMLRHSDCFSCAAEHFTTSFSKPMASLVEGLCTGPFLEGIIPARTVTVQYVHLGYRETIAIIWLYSSGGRSRPSSRVVMPFISVCLDVSSERDQHCSDIQVWAKVRYQGFLNSPPQPEADSPNLVIKLLLNPVYLLRVPIPFSILSLSFPFRIPPTTRPSGIQPSMPTFTPASTALAMHPSSWSAVGLSLLAFGWFYARAHSNQKGVEPRSTDREDRFYCAQNHNSHSVAVNKSYRNHGIIKNKIESFSSRFSIFYDSMSSHCDLYHAHSFKNLKV